MDTNEQASRPRPHPADTRTNKERFVAALTEAMEGKKFKSVSDMQQDLSQSLPQILGGPLTAAEGRWFDQALQEWMILQTWINPTISNIDEEE